MATAEQKIFKEVQSHLVASCNALTKALIDTLISASTNKSVEAIRKALENKQDISNLLNLAHAEHTDLRQACITLEKTVFLAELLIAKPELLEEFSQIGKTLNDKSFPTLEDKIDEYHIQLEKKKFLKDCEVKDLNEVPGSRSRCHAGVQQQLRFFEALRAKYEIRKNLEIEFFWRWKHTIATTKNPKPDPKVQRMIVFSGRGSYLGKQVDYPNKPGKEYDDRRRMRLAVYHGQEMYKMTGQYPEIDYNGRPVHNADLRKSLKLVQLGVDPHLVELKLNEEYLALEAEDARLDKEEAKIDAEELARARKTQSEHWKAHSIKWKELEEHWLRLGDYPADKVKVFDLPISDDPTNPNKFYNTKEQFLSFKRELNLGNEETVIVFVSDAFHALRLAHMFGNSRINPVPGKKCIGIFTNRTLEGAEEDVIGERRRIFEYARKGDLAHFPSDTVMFTDHQEARMEGMKLRESQENQSLLAFSNLGVADLSQKGVELQKENRHSHSLSGKA